MITSCFQWEGDSQLLVLSFMRQCCPIAQSHSNVSIVIPLSHGHLIRNLHCWRCIQKKHWMLECLRAFALVEIEPWMLTALATILKDWCHYVVLHDFENPQKELPMKVLIIVLSIFNFETADDDGGGVSSKYWRRRSCASAQSLSHTWLHITRVNIGRFPVCRSMTLVTLDKETFINRSANGAEAASVVDFINADSEKCSVDLGDFLFLLTDL